MEKNESADGLTIVTSEVIKITYDDLVQALYNWMEDNNRMDYLENISLEHISIDIPVPLDEDGNISFEYDYLTYNDAYDDSELEDVKDV